MPNARVTTATTVNAGRVAAHGARCERPASPHHMRAGCAQPSGARQGRRQLSHGRVRETRPFPYPSLTTRRRAPPTMRFDPFIRSFAKGSFSMRGVERWRWRARITCVFLLIGAAGGAAIEKPPRLPVRRFPSSSPTTIAAPAGTLRSRHADARAPRRRPGAGSPKGPAGPTLEIEAFGEVGKALTVPAPLIRVVEGTEIVVSIRNDLDAALVVHGLCTRDGTPCAPLEVPPASNTRGAIQERRCRNLPLLGVDDRRARALSRAGRRVCRRRVRGRGRTRPDPGDHRMDEPHAPASSVKSSRLMCPPKCSSGSSRGSRS